MIKVFKWRELYAAIDCAVAGGQSLHLHRIVFPDSPIVFRDAIARGEHIAHLFDQDEERLIATARRFGITYINVERRGTDRQHIDLCAEPLRSAMADAQHLTSTSDQKDACQE